MLANADGTGEHKLLAASGFDYHASYSYDGKWIVFTSERSGFGAPGSKMGAKMVAERVDKTPEPPGAQERHHRDARP